MITNLDDESDDSSGEQTPDGGAHAGNRRHASALEAALLRRVGAGDRKALQELYHLYSKPLYSYALKVLGNEQDAEEVVQDAFVRYWKKAAKYDPARSKPFAWAVLILRGICFDRLRQRKKLSHPPTLPDSERFLEKLPDRSIESLAFRETAQFVRTAISRLAPEERSCIELAVFGEFSHSGIAEKLGRPLGTVKSQVRRGMGKLRHLLRPEDSQ
jgi:RNA polymerase sigma-70 factor (ECF subfamily)